MSRTYDTDRPMPGVPPLVLAARLADEMFTEATDRHRFMGLFRMNLVAATRGGDNYHVYRDALESGDSLAVAAHVEAMAASRGTPSHQKPRMYRLIERNDV